MKETKDKREAVALRQRRYRMKKQMEGYTRLQLYVPKMVADQIQAIADKLINNPSLQFAEMVEATQTYTRPLSLTQKKVATAPKKPLPLTQKKVATAPKKAEEPAKYRNPKNPAETWSGTGRKPAWLMVRAGIQPDRV